MLIPVGLVNVEVTKVQWMPVGAEVEHVEAVMKERAYFKSLGIDDRAYVHRLLPFSIFAFDGEVDVTVSKTANAVAAEVKCVSRVRHRWLRIPRYGIYFGPEISHITPGAVGFQVCDEYIAAAKGLRGVTSCEKEKLSILA
jgi:hypothetical protein